MLVVNDYESVYVIGDIHGDLPRLVSILLSIGLISFSDGRLYWEAPRGTVLVQLGDQLDSRLRTDLYDGSWEKTTDVDVVRFMTSLRYLAEAKGSRVISLLGNHEALNMAHLFHYVSEKSLALSGGEPGRKSLFHPGSPFVMQHLVGRPIAVRIGDYLMSHAGILPEHVQGLSAASYEVDLWLRSGRPMSEATREIVDGEDGVLWTRKLTNPAFEPHARTASHHLGAKYQVVGHSVVPEATWSPGGAVLFLDTGVSRSLGGNNAYVLTFKRDQRPKILKCVIAT